MIVILLLTLIGFAGCAGPTAYERAPAMVAPGTFVLYYGARGPLTYQTLTPREIPKDASDIGKVECSVCQHGLSIPLFSNIAGLKNLNISGSGGDGSFNIAFSDLQKKYPGLKGIYDVKVDIRSMNVLGIYKKVCTEIAARGFR